MFGLLVLLAWLELLALGLAWLRRGLGAGGRGGRGSAAALVGLLALVVFSALHYLALLRQGAPLGVLTLPFYALAVGALAFATVWTLGGLVAWWRAGRPRRSRQVAVALVACLLLVAEVAALVVFVAAERRVAVASDSAVAPRHLAELSTAALAHRDRHVLVALAGNPATPPEALATIAERDEDWLRRPGGGLRDLWLGRLEPVHAVIAAHPRAPLRALERLAESGSQQVAAAVAGNPRTPPRLLAALGERDEMTVGLALSHNPGTPVAVLADLARHESEYVRAEVAERPELSRRDLAELAADESWVVRRSAAGNPRLDPVAARQLMHDPVLQVRLALAANRSVGRQVLEELAERDPSAPVRRTAQATLRRRRRAVHPCRVAGDRLPVDRLE